MKPPRPFPLAKGPPPTPGAEAPGAFPAERKRLMLRFVVALIVGFAVGAAAVPTFARDAGVWVDWR